jgi:hypothetical protein
LRGEEWAATEGQPQTAHYATADSPLLVGGGWIEAQWAVGRLPTESTFSLDMLLALEAALACLMRVLREAGERPRADGHLIWRAIDGRTTIGTR